MVAKYNLIKCNNDYIIHEDKTSNILKRTRSKAFGKKLVDCLNNGSGFAGDVPDFFIMKKDIAFYVHGR